MAAAAAAAAAVAAAAAAAQEGFSRHSGEDRVAAKLAVRRMLWMAVVLRDPRVPRASHPLISASSASDSEISGSFCLASSLYSLSSRWFTIESSREGVRSKRSDARPGKEFLIQLRCYETTLSLKSLCGGGVPSPIMFSFFLSGVSHTGGRKHRGDVHS